MWHVTAGDLEFPPSDVMSPELGGWGFGRGNNQTSQKVIFQPNIKIASVHQIARWDWLWNLEERSVCYSVNNTDNYARANTFKTC